jgi:uncharacterized protein YdiU (UPF0061 family)
LLDLGTKGSGLTPYSRTADGRLTLKGAVREILATEMLEALGVYTSKTFSVIETGEELERGDEPSPTRSAVLVRLSHSHIRIGTFQRLAVLEEDGHMRALVDYCLAQFPGPPPPEDAPSATSRRVVLMHQAVERLADLAASYMAAGFVHGVLNSDNMNVTGESFDYGPWRWLPQWDPGFTAAYFDRTGLYAFGRQPDAIRWNLAQLAIALRRLVEAPPLVAAMERFPELYHRAITRRVRLAARGREPGLEATSASARRRGDAREQVGRTRLSSPTAGGRSARASWRGARRLTAAGGDHEYWSERARDDADRRGRGDLGGDRRARRLAPLAQDRRGSRNGRSDGRAAGTAGHFL